MITQISPIPNDFRFTLEATNAADGSIELQFEPDGWQGYASLWARDERYHGVYRTIETQMRFINDGAAFLLSEYQKYGVNARTKIIIEKLNYETLEYGRNFYGEFNFAQMESGQGITSVDYVDIAVTEWGIVNLLRAREKNNIEIPLDETRPEITVVEPANAWLSAELFIGGEIKGIGVGINTPILPTEDSFILFSERSSSWFSNLLELNKPDLKGHEISSGYHRLLFYDPSNWIGEPIILRIQFSFKASATNGILRFFPVAGGSAIVESSTFADELITSTNPSVEWEMVVTFGKDYPDYIGAFTLGIGAFATSGQNVDFKFLEGSEITIEGMSESLLKPFPIRAISAFDLFKELTKNIGSDEITDTHVVSELLTTGDLKDIYLTSGDAVRDIRDVDTGKQTAVLKTNFLDFFDSIFAIYPIALEIMPDGKTLSIEKYETAYKRSTKILELGEVTSLKITPAISRMNNQIIVGSADKNYTAINGRFEFNVENIFTLPLLRISTERKLIPKYRTDSFGITDTKISYEPKPTTTGSSDNDVFMIQTEFDEIIRKPQGLPVRNYNQITGNNIQMMRRGIFNLWLSPKRCLMRHGRILSSTLFYTPDKIIQYTGTSKTDAILTSIDDITTIIEHSDYDVSNENPIWRPELYEVEVNLPRNLIAEMDDLSKKGGYIQFSFRGLNYRGFPIDIRQVHWTNPQQTIKLLAHPLSPFTYGYNLITEDWNLITGIENLITYDVDIEPFVPAVIKSLTANPLVVEISAFTGGTEYVSVEATGGSWEIFHVSSQYVTATKESESSLSISIGRAAGNRIFEVDIRHTIDQRLELRITVLQRF